MCKSCIKVFAALGRQLTPDEAVLQESFGAVDGKGGNVDTRLEIDGKMATARTWRCGHLSRAGVYVSPDTGTVIVPCRNFFSKPIRPGCVRDKAD